MHGIRKFMLKAKSVEEIKKKLVEIASAEGVILSGLNGIEAKEQAV